MINYFLDSNIIIRFLIGEPNNQKSYTQAVFDTIEKEECNAYINSLILHEVLYTMINYYQINKKNVVARLLKILSLDNFDMHDIAKKDAINAMKKYSEKNVDFPDCVFSVIAKTNKYKLVSFDQHFKKLGINPVTLLD